MLHVLRHYLPVRKLMLMGSELAILAILVFLGMSAHLWWQIDTLTSHRIAVERLSVPDARWRCLISAVMVAVLAQVAIGFNELYDFRISSSRFERAARFLGSAGSAILLVLGAMLLVSAWNIERILDFPGLPFTQALVLLTTTMTAGFALLYVWRNVFHFALRRFSFNQRILILGTGEVGMRLAEELRTRDDSGYDVVGMISPPSAEARAAVGAPGGEPAPLARRPGASRGSGYSAAADGPAEGGAITLVLERDRDADPSVPAPERAITEPLTMLVERLQIDDIVVALEDRRGLLPTRDLLACRLNGVGIEEAEAVYERVAGKIAVEAMRPSYLIFNRGFRLHPLGELAKRGLDVLLALVVFVVTWPLMILTAIAIRMDSKGPILYRQERVGRHGEPFTLMKFRSMRQDAESGTGPVWAQTDDPRITRVGKFLRRTRLDELPQLFNVLGGSMSMVGPRPERQKFVEELSAEIPYFRQRHIVKPGLTGWAQINYPYGNTVDDASQKLQYDLFYIKYQSLLFDLSILFHTIKTVVLRKGT
jgi:lipopolysaccharide/colanic/teichoic acid biosynthesis glycosyltransferase